MLSLAKKLTRRSNLVLDKTSCWIWKGGTHNGVGQCHHNGRTIQTNIASFLEFKQNAHKHGLVVDQTCGTKACWRPSHLVERNATPKSHLMSNVTVKLDKTSCWVWGGHKTKFGYGIVKTKIDTKQCIRPSHLFLGTNADNVRDRDEKGRRVTPRGESSGQSKLTEDDIGLIRILHKRRRIPVKAMVQMFAIDKSTFYDIVNRTTWKHVK